MNPLVSVAWLAERIGAPHLVVLDATLPPVGVLPGVDTRARYLAAHIPGAIFFDIDALSDPGSTLPHTLPGAADFAGSMAALGVGSRMTIVVYEQDGVFSAPRARWMLRTLGASEVYVLDGGLQAWEQAGLAVEAGEVRRPRADFHARFDREAVKTFEDVERTIAERGQILDARSAGRFSGVQPEPRPGLSSGHMPGATSVPFTELVEQGRIRRRAELEAIFAGKGIDLSRPVTTTCGSGVTAAVVSLALEMMGARQVALYDGSWAEYAGRPEAVIVKEHASSVRER